MKRTNMSYRLLPILLALVATAGIGLITTQAISTSRASHTTVVSRPSSGHLPVLLDVTGPQTGERFEAELVALLPAGFEPAQITRPTGRFLFGVDNRTGLQELSLQLVHETGRTVAGNRMSRC